MSDLINFFADNASLLLDRTWEHIVISAIGLVIALVLALPVGIILGHLHKGSLLAINISNVLRALPSLALIAISLAFIGLSRLNITIALVALAVPPILTNAYTAVDGVDPDAVESARGMGMTERQVLTGDRAAAVVAADLRRHPHRVGLRHRHGAAGRARRRRRPRRHHRQPGDLRARGRDRRDDRHGRAGVRRRRAAAPSSSAAHAHRPRGLEGTAHDRPARRVGPPGRAGGERQPIGNKGRLHGTGTPTRYCSC